MESLRSRRLIAEPRQADVMLESCSSLSSDIIPRFAGLVWTGGSAGTRMEFQGQEKHHEGDLGRNSKWMCLGKVGNLGKGFPQLEQWGKDKSLHFWGRSFQLNVFGSVPEQDGKGIFGSRA